MTDNFDKFLQLTIENMMVNNVASVGTGWNDTSGGVPKVLGPMQRRRVNHKKRKKKR